MPSRLRVPAGYVLGALAVLLARPTWRTLLLGAPLALLGEIVRLWASGHIEKTRALATGGPYAHTRNPLYVGSLLLGLGLGAAAGSLWVVAIVTLYFAAFYPHVMREEAAFLARTFPAYETWAREVPLFLPRSTPAGPRATRFSWQRVRRNREWRSVIAVPAMMAILWMRGLLPLL